MADSIEERFEEVARRLHELTPSPFSGPASPETIVEAEAELAVTFPLSYRLFLREFGAGDIPFDIYGVDPEAESKQWGCWSVVGMTQSEREDVEPRMRHSLIPFTPDGAGNHWCLDTSRLVGGECPIVFWNHEGDEDQEVEQTHPAFLDWLEETLESEDVQEYFADKRNFA